jgi:WD40 repeat protein
MMTFDYHTDSVRAVEYSPDGNMIYTGSKDMSLAVITNGTMAGRIMDAHPAPIHTVMHVEQGNVIASGDDDGMIRIWDLRKASSGKKHAIVMEFAEHEGTVTSMAYHKESQQVVSVSNDGMLGVFDLRKGELYAMSDNFEEDLSSVAIMKDGKKVVASSADGIINIFSWDYFGDCNDRIVGHPGTIDTMIKYDEDTLITGCEDGLIRAVSVLPNKIAAVLGDPLDNEEEVFHI